MFDEVSEWIAGVDPRYESRLQDNVTLYRGTVSFLSNNEISITNQGGDEIAQVSSHSIVIATGTCPRPAPYSGLPVWTSDDIFPLKEAPPASLTIIGGGFIGCELGAFFSAIGTETSLHVRGNTLLPRIDHELSPIFQEHFEHHTPVHYESSLSDLSYDGKIFTCTFTHPDGSSHQHIGERVLCATGRIANTDKLQLKNTDIVTNSRGFIQADDHLETSVPGIYAAGDIAGKFILQHTASYDMHYLRQTLLKGNTEALDYGAVPHAIFTEPEVASVGFTETELQEKGIRYVKTLRDWKSSARAMASKLDYPRTKILICPDTYSVLGCHLIGPDSSTLIHQILMLMHLKNDIREVPKMIHIHPALPELFLDAAVDVIKQAKAANK
jgi:mycothione reductase